MIPQFIMLRLGELTLKGRNRSRFEQAVVRDIRSRLSQYPNIKLFHEFGRIYLQLNGEPYPQVANQLKKIFGLYSFSPVWACDPEYGDILETAIALMKSSRSSAGSAALAFRATVRRVDKQFPYDSMEMGRLVGQHLLQSIDGLKVDLHHPDIDLRIEIRRDAAYIYSEVVQGAGGFPADSNGRAMLMLSGGIDSPVAGWLALRKGLAIECIHFHSYPYTSERARNKVIDLARTLANYTHSMRLHLVPLADFQTRLHSVYKGSLEITLTRRMMFRLAERLAELNQARAIVTGESLGQVASQTLPSLDAISNVVQMPILRPLIMMDKLEIINIAERIHTYDISIQPYEDCCTLFVPKSPSTNPNLQKIEQLESGLDWLHDVFEEAIAHTETMVISLKDKDVTDDLF